MHRRCGRHRHIRRWGCGLIASAALGTVGAAQQPPEPAYLPAPASVPSGPMPPCAPVLDSFPCHTPFDVAPLIQSHPQPVGKGPHRVPVLWVFVTAAGEVKKAIIEQPTTLDHDLTARSIMRRARFTPATLDGRPVPVWVLVPVSTASGITPCSPNAMPLSAGTGSFRDSLVLERPELGTRFRYDGRAGVDFEVSRYREHGWPGTADQAAAFVDSFAVMRDRGEVGAFVLIAREPITVTTKRFRDRKGASLRGHTLVVRVPAASGGPRDSYVAVFAHAGAYYRFRASYSDSPAARRIVRAFVQDFLGAVVAMPPPCGS